MTPALPAAVSWGRYPRLAQRRVEAAWRGDVARILAEGGSALPRGAGRSYGDCGQNEGGTLVDVSRMDRFIAFDAARAEVTVEAGMLLRDVARWAQPRGFRLPATPGTLDVTVGGAIANDVHGKNHHVAGTFGCHVRRFSLLRGDGKVVECTPGDELFVATIGGLGLTGIVLEATLALRPVRSSFIQAESIPFEGLDGFFGLAADSNMSWEHTVAWLDCTSRGAGRGLFQRGRHVEDDEASLARPWTPRSRRVPFDFPEVALSSLTVRAFNALYYRFARSSLRRVPAEKFLYPLDAIGDWNRLYGRRGFLQFQCVVPPTQAPVAMSELLRAITASGEGSFLSVIKTFGDIASPGLMSFPRPGTTFALDFPMRGESTLRLLKQLERITLAAGGAIYPAKDACMGADIFRTSFPNLERFRASVDPAFSSSFWRRVGAPAHA